MNTNHSLCHHLYRMKFEVAGFLCVATAAYLLASSEWRRGLVIGLTIGGIMAYLGKAVRHSRVAQN